MSFLTCETNQIELFEYLCARAGGNFVREPGYTWADDRPVPGSCAIWAMDLRDNGLLAAIRQRIESGELPNQVLTGPTCTPPDLESARSLLLAAGFAMRWTALAMELDFAGEVWKDAAQSPPLPTGALLSMPAEARSLAAWARVVCTGLFKVDDAQADLFGRRCHRAAGERLAFFLLCAADGTPAAASAAWLGSTQTGGLYWVATLPEYRRRGYARAVVHAALAWMHRAGMKTCILQATNDGAPLYAQFGFKPCGELGRFYLPKEEQK